MSFKGLYIQTKLHNKFLKKLFSQNHSTLGWILTSTHKQHIMSINHPSHKRLPAKSCPDCLRILIMFWLLKDPAVIMREIMPALFKDPTVTVAWIDFDYTQSNSKKCPKKIKLLQMRFFLEKLLIKFSCTSWPLSLCKIFKKTVADQKLWGWTIFGLK